MNLMDYLEDLGAERALSEKSETGELPLLPLISPLQVRTSSAMRRPWTPR